MDFDDQGTVRARKRIRLQSPEPDFPNNIGDPLWSEPELFPELMCDDDSWASIFQPTDEGNDEGRLDIVTESFVAETVRDVCLGVVSF
jgi:hypothetical protein